MGRLEELHNFKPIDKDVEKALVSIRDVISKKTPKLTEKQKHITRVAFEHITGKKEGTGCADCLMTLKILNNWLNNYYDLIPKPLKPVKTFTAKDSLANDKGSITETVLSNPNPSYKELKEEAFKRGYIHKGKGNPKKADLIEYLKG